MCISFIYIIIGCILLLILFLQHISYSFQDFLHDYNETNNGDIIKKEITNINIYTKEIDELKKQLNEERNKNKILEEENKSLKNKINKLEQENNNNSTKKYDNNDTQNYINMIETLNNNIQKLTLENDNLKAEINLENNLNSKEREIVRLYKKIEDLTEKINRYPFILEKDETMLSIIFMSVSQKVNYSMICKNTDTINKLESELYKEYPELSETENYFLCKGTIMNKFIKFKEFNIKNGDVIILNQKKD